MIKTVIIDDEPLARNMITGYLKSYPEIQIVAECNDGFEGTKAIMAHQPDLIFLDIQMPKITGFEMLELIDERPAVFFTTAYDEYALKAFEQHAVDYLLKPISKPRFDKALQKFFTQRETVSASVRTNKLLEEKSVSDPINRIMIRTGNTIKIIPIDEIILLEADGDYVKIHTQDMFYLKNKTMAYFEKVLEQKKFVRVHRSYMVNVNQMIKIEPYEKDGHVIILKHNKRAYVSRSGYGKLRDVLGM